MTEAIQLSPQPETSESSRLFERRCLNSSLALSSVSVLVGVIGWWLVRFANLTAAEEGGRVRDLLNIDWGNGPLPLLLFVTFVVGAASLVLALLGAGASRSAPWKAVVAGMLGAAILMVPVITVANSLVTAGIWNTGGD